MTRRIRKPIKKIKPLPLSEFPVRTAHYQGTLAGFFLRDYWVDYTVEDRISDMNRAYERVPKAEKVLRYALRDYIKRLKKGLQ